jgi:hypothetical protein
MSAALEDTNTQYAPYPAALAEMVEQSIYRKHEGWRVALRNVGRDENASNEVIGGGLTLVITTKGINTYDHEQTDYRVAHYFIVPAATYNRRSWLRWLFEQYAKVELHECMENFVLRHTTPGGYIRSDGSHSDHFDERPFAPLHGPGDDPYVVHEFASQEQKDRRYFDHSADEVV